MPDDAGATLSATERVAISRERIRQAMLQHVRPSRKRLDPATGEPVETSDWMAKLSGVPGVGVLIDGVRGWWAQHPWRLASLLGKEAVMTVFRPLARNNPVGLVVGAVAFGAVIVWLKPWRGLLKPALFAGLLPHLLSKAVMHVPTESWLAVLTSLAQTPGPQARPATAAGAVPAGAAGTPSGARAVKTSPPTTAASGSATGTGTDNTEQVTPKAPATRVPGAGDTAPRSSTSIVH
jgi:hypothetical protein